MQMSGSAVVIGASGGIGRALTQRLVAEGGELPGQGLDHGEHDGLGVAVGERGGVVAQ
jgi:NAD(P)-dependent dehydrogenase (short-subunit alcohol dehydrogenase family)